MNLFFRQYIKIVFSGIFIFLHLSCKNKTQAFQSETSKNKILVDPNFNYKKTTRNASDIIIDRTDYHNKLYGFWLGQCIANWTGLVTEMDKIGNIGEIKTGPSYTRDDWGKPDLPSIWGEGEPSSISKTIDFVFENDDGIWGADDDTDIEYMYQHLLYVNKTSVLTGKQIKEGWLKHIKAEEENYLWVSNQTAFDLMQNGLTPPETSLPENNPNFDMIDAQLTTEVFGFFAPSRPELALKMAYLPIRTTANGDAALIAEFYVNLYALATTANRDSTPKESILAMAKKARKRLPVNSYPAKMFDFVLHSYKAGIPWEQTRDLLYQKYQVNQEDGYTITSKKLYCNGCFAAGINFGASIISLLYGEGDLIRDFSRVGF